MLFSTSRKRGCAGQSFGMVPAGTCGAPTAVNATFEDGQ